MKTYVQLLFIIGLTLAVQLSYGQSGIGIGTTSPDGSAILHIVSPSTNKGLMVPSFGVSRIPVIPVTSASDGVLFYDPGIAKFCFYHSGTWYTLNQMVQTVNQFGVSSTLTHTGDMTVTGSATVTANFTAGTVSASDYGLNSTGNGPVPKGGIIMWHGATNAVPTGWALCDGGSGTPDLRDRFVVGAGNSYAVNATGGEALHTITQAEMPSHSHSINDPGHTHGYNQIALQDLHNGSANGNPDGPNVPSTTGSSTTGISINNTGGGAAFENRPPYYALAYIMKL